MRRLATRAMALIRMPFIEQRAMAPAASEPPPIDWSDPATYDERLRDDFVLPLRQAAAQHGTVPAPLQLDALSRLHWYFTIDARPMAPTMIVNDAMAPVFHQRVAEIMALVNAEALTALPPAVSPEVRHALYSYQSPVMSSAVAIDAYDAEQRLVRITYWVHGPRPVEVFDVDGREVQPAFGKYRGCVYFGRLLMRQRIAWIPVPPDAAVLRVVLDGVNTRVAVGPQPFALDGASPVGSGATPQSLLREARQAYRHRWALPGDPPAASARWKARVVKALAQAPFIRARFRDAWVLCDRAHDADDNAEHLYRWLRENRPEVNAWFLLNPGTPDWQRLEREGFRLIGPGLMRKLLLLNSRHVISSHPENDTGGFNRRVYADAMQWRFTYLKHGVTVNDQSHYYRDRQFDCLIAVSPAEYRHLVGDDSPYALTAREVKHCNFPRFDRLLQLAGEVGPDGANEILIMPTWRARLIDDHLDPAERMRRLRESDYARQWRDLLNDPRLKELAEAHGKRIVLLPHSNLRPYLSAFELSPHVDVAPMHASIQEHLAKCCAFITDYTSVAFDVALLRRGIFYFQFDRDGFYGGAHNWRPGYFDFERDGFGPVERSPGKLLDRVGRFVEAGARADAGDIGRMERAMPDLARNACERVYALVDGLSGQ